MSDLDLKLNFPADVWYPLLQLAREERTDVNSLLVIGAKVVLEAKRRNLLRIDRMPQMVDGVLSKGDA